MAGNAAPTALPFGEACQANIQPNSGACAGDAPDYSAQAQ